jgi:hypothetical protein
MKLLSAVLVAATLLMLAIHLASWRLVAMWYAGGSSWVHRHLPPLRLIRIEALYWSLTLAAWPLWGTLAWKLLVGIFAGIHIGGWVVAELRRPQLPAGLTDLGNRRVVTLAVTGFDLIEAVALVAVGLGATRYFLSA